jgi:hypothetical protein
MYCGLVLHRDPSEFKGIGLGLVSGDPAMLLKDGLPGLTVQFLKDNEWAASALRDDMRNLRNNIGTTSIAMDENHFAGAGNDPEIEVEESGILTLTWMGIKNGLAFLIKELGFDSHVDTSMLYYCLG